LASAGTASREQDVEAVVAVVGIGGEQIGIPVEFLRNIVRTPPISRLPGTPPWLLGLVQVRGDLLTAVDLGRWLRIEKASEARFLAVLEGPRGRLGVVAESVSGFREISRDEVAQRLVISESGTPILSMTRDLVTVIDAARLLESPQVVIAARRQGKATGTS
jgi:purine-binding chemotaxis protein CheW